MVYILFEITGLYIISSGCLSSRKGLIYSLMLRVERLGVHA